MEVKFAGRPKVFPTVPSTVPSRSMTTPEM
jgi:hypothetical protein